VVALLVLMFALQYVTVSNVPLEAQPWTDAASYGEQLSSLPLDRPLSELARWAAPVLLQPLYGVFRHGSRHGWTGLAGSAKGLLLPASARTGVVSRSEIARMFAVFSGINTLAWSFAVGLAYVVVKRFRRRFRRAHVT
jgi:hypothetical protein